MSAAIPEIFGTANDALFAPHSPPQGRTRSDALEDPAAALDTRQSAANEYSCIISSQKAMVEGVLAVYRDALHRLTIPYRRNCFVRFVP